MQRRDLMTMTGAASLFAGDFAVVAWAAGR